MAQVVVVDSLDLKTEVLFSIEVVELPDPWGARMEDHPYSRSTIEQAAVGLVEYLSLIHI